MAVRMLTAEHAVIHTATVEVKTLTISGRQVTLSVFRQLPEESVLDPDSGEMMGDPWGHVNYHWGDMRKVLHVVWQDGSRLYRSLVPVSRPHDGFEAGAISERHDQMNALVQEYWRCRVRAWEPRAVVEDDTLRIEHEGWQWTRAIAELDLAVRDWLRYDDGAVPRMLRKPDPAAPHRLIEDHVESLEEVVERQRKERERIVSWLSHAKTRTEEWIILAELRLVSEDWKRREAQRQECNERWSANYRRLTALDQLFIAV